MEILSLLFPCVCLAILAYNVKHRGSRRGATGGEGAKMPRSNFGIRMRFWSLRPFFRMARASELRVSAISQTETMLAWAMLQREVSSSNIAPSVSQSRMAKFIIRLYLKTEPVPFDHGELLEQMEIEAEDIKAAVNKACSLAPTFRPDATFGMVHTETDEPYYPMDLRPRARNAKRT